jgi:uncharacterized repeat protein (TIGR03803 family)
MNKFISSRMLRVIVALPSVALLFGLAVTVASAQNYTNLHDFTGADGGPLCTTSILAQGQDGNLYGTACFGGTNGVGVLFKITPDGAYTVLYNFDTTHGSIPKGGLTLGRDGNLYGTSQNGGANGAGNVFQIDSFGSLTVLHDFTFGSDGGAPYAAPVQGDDGNFYGNVQNFSGTSFSAYQMTPPGGVTMFGQNPGYSLAPLLQATNGNFYGTSVSGGAGYGTIFTPTASGASLYNFDNANGASPEAGLVEGNDGNLYGTAPFGGTGGGGVAFKITASGVYTVLHDFAGPISEGNEPTAGLVLGSDGNFYGMTCLGGTGSGFGGVAFKITPSGSYSVLFNFDIAHGELPCATPVQHTNGKIYGLAVAGGAFNQGVIYSLDVALPPFVKLTSRLGRVGDAVGILGNGLTGTSNVAFDGTAAAFTVISDTYLRAAVPAGTTGRVTVTTPGGTLTSNQRYRVLPTIATIKPTTGTVGKKVVITGTGLTQTRTVTFNGVKAPNFAVKSDSRIAAKVPQGATSGKIGVTTLGGSTRSIQTFTVVHRGQN